MQPSQQIECLLYLTTLREECGRLGQKEAAQEVRQRSQTGQRERDPPRRDHHVGGKVGVQPVGDLLYLQQRVHARGREGTHGEHEIVQADDEAARARGRHLGEVRWGGDGREAEGHAGKQPAGSDHHPVRRARGDEDRTGDEGEAGDPEDRDVPAGLQHPRPDERAECRANLGLANDELRHRVVESEVGVVA